MVYNERNGRYPNRNLRSEVGYCSIGPYEQIDEIARGFHPGCRQIKLLSGYIYLSNFLKKGQR